MKKGDKWTNIQTYVNFMLLALELTLSGTKYKDIAWWILGFILINTITLVVRECLKLRR